MFNKSIYWGHIPNYKKITFFDGDKCKSDFIDWLLDLEEYFNFWNICNEKKCGLHLINWTMKQRNGEKTFKSIKNGEVSIQYALGKEWKGVNWFMVS